jgi:branched-chain amino acid aminotransferase
VLHYASTCFEGFKAFRHADGSVHTFRMDRHIERMRQSARQLVLPEPDAAQLADMVRAVIERCRDRWCRRRRARCICGRFCSAPRRTSAPRRRPPNEALLLVLASPVWDYFAGGMKPLRILVDDENTRSAAQMGMVKTGGNYAAAMGPTLSARAQVPGRSGAVLSPRRGARDRRRQFPVDPRRRALTRSLDSTFLHGVTRDSLLTLARDRGFKVSERVFDVEEMLEWVKSGEAALSGTAAVLAAWVR